MKQSLQLESSDTSCRSFRMNVSCSVKRCFLLRESSGFCDDKSRGGSGTWGAYFGILEDI